MSCLNPNVFFELGIRTALNKPVCMVHDGISGNVPFDTSIVNYHSYSSNIAPWKLPEQIELLAEHIAKSNSGDQNSSLWQYFGLSSRAHSLVELPDNTSANSDRLDYLALQIEAIRSQLSGVSKNDTPVSSKFDDTVSSDSFLHDARRAFIDKEFSLKKLSEATGLEEAVIVEIMFDRAKPDFESRMKIIKALDLDN